MKVNPPPLKKNKEIPNYFFRLEYASDDLKTHTCEHTHKLSRHKNLNISKTTTHIKKVKLKIVSFSKLAKKCIYIFLVENFLKLSRP